MTDKPAPAGYSGTPLAKKLGVKAGHRILLRHAPAGWTVPGLPPGVTVGRATAAPDPGITASAAGNRAANAGIPASTGGIPAGATVGVPPGVGIPADIIVVFCRSRRQLEDELVDLTSRLPAASSLWIAWPRRAAGHSSDITENGLRELLLPVGVVDVKVAALDHDWSGLKFVWRKAMRK